MGWLDRIVCNLVEPLELFGPTLVVGVLVGLAALVVGASGLRRLVRRLLPEGTPTASPADVASILVLIASYSLFALIDPLLKSTLRRPLNVSEDHWNRIGFFEWKFIGGEWSAAMLPLVEHPAIGLVLHAIFWIAAALLVRTALQWFHRDSPIGWDTPQASLPWYYRWAGSSTARRADGRFSSWVRTLLFILVPLHVLSGYLAAAEAELRFQRSGVVCSPTGADEPALGGADETDVADGSEAVSAADQSETNGETSAGEAGIEAEPDADDNQLTREEIDSRPEAELRNLAEQLGLSPELVSQLDPSLLEQLPPELRESLRTGDTESIRQQLEDGLAGENSGLDSLLPGVGGITELLSERFSAGPIEGAPAPGAWILFGLLFMMLSIHLVTEARPPKPKKVTEEEEDETAPEPVVDPLRRLGDALQAKVPGAFLEALEHQAAKPGTLGEFPDRTSPLVVEAFRIATGQDKPWAHQAEVLAHLSSAWEMSGTAELKAAPVLEEQLAPSPIRSSIDTPHALVIAPEGAGRTTLTRLAAVHVHLDRGATTLVVARDHEEATRWASGLRHTLEQSSARWNVFVTLAGDDLGAALLSNRTPNIIVAGLEELESHVLLNSRTDGFFQKLGLVVADDVDRFTGVAEMHLQMTMRRLWALVDRVQDAPYPVALLATTGPSGSGIDSWARHVLSAPLRIFDRDTAPRCTQTRLRRRDLADSAGEAIPLRVLAEACDAAGLAWHLRQAGDEKRTQKSPETDLGSLRRHHQSDPRLAEVVLIEGTYPDVRREADRLAHAGLQTESQVVVLVLGPPADEEMVLHEEATDAAHRDLVDHLPRAVNLTEPKVVRQRHLDRAIGREQDVEALKQRFGRELIGEMLDRLKSSGRVRFRKVWFFDPVSDSARSRDLVRAGAEAALGEPIEDTCVSDAEDRVVILDRGTGETLRFTDRAIADALFPPGTVFVHPRGRYRVIGMGESERTRECEQINDAVRTTPDQRVELERFRPVWADRELGGFPVSIALAHTQVRETTSGIRSYAPGPKLVEHRTYETSVSSSYSTDVCLLANTNGTALPPIEQPALVPLVAAINMMIPCYLRGAEGLVGAAVVEIEDRPAIAVFDRTPGASGFTRHIHERGLGELLRLARLTLERLVGPEFTRLRRIHDRSDLAQEHWDGRGALEWLDRVLDPDPEKTPDAVDERRGRRVVFQDGEGHGDLGRLWISSTGRTDDLVWTRHTWHSKHPIRNHAPGRVSLDVAVERRTIAYSIRQAVARGAAKVPMEITDAGEWVKQHRAALSTADVDLVALVDRLRDLAGENYVDAALGLVAEIPTHGSRLSVADRTPLAVLARRRADIDAKVLLAWAMLPTEYKPTIKLTDQGPALEVLRGGEMILVDLSANGVRILDHADGEPLDLGSES